MPLSEFLRMAGRKIESSPQRPCPTDLSSRPENDLVELVWENGQIMMQGQPSRVTSSPPARESINTNKVGETRIGKFGGVESILNDMSPVVPSGDLDLSQDDEMGPWLDALAQDYGSVLLPPPPEISISGVRANGMSTQNDFVSVVDRSSSCEQSKARLVGSWPPPQHGQTLDALELGVSDIISNTNNTSNHSRPDVVLGNPAQGRDIVNDSTRPPTTYLNFSHFARPANLVKAKVPNSDQIPTSGMERVEVKEKGLAASDSIPVRPTTKDSSPPERTENLCQETSGKNDKGERIVEPIVASSSIGSGNSADRVSCEQTCNNSKRKIRDTEESEYRSDDVETESVGVKKPTVARGSGSKRSRAADVHNLSERRRRDRINEKMRALQELIPNCNKYQADKASMLDEAIEYLKTLQLQVQIMSMGAGLCMPPMMFPPGMQHMHPAHIPHFSPMGVGMGMRFGMGMLDMNGGCPVFPVSPLQAPHFPASMPTSFQRMYGHPGQGLPNSAPLTGQPPVDSAMGLSAFMNGSQNAASSTSPILNSGDITNPNSQLNCNAKTDSSIIDKSDQLPATNEVLNQSATVQENKQPTDASGPTTR